MTTERDIRNQIAYARDKGLKQGREEGREEGRKEGREEGREEGLEEGFRLMAEQLRKMGLPEDEIERAVSEAKKS